MPAFCFTGIFLCSAVFLIHAQEAPAGGDTVIRAETRLVLVDAVAVDKKNKFASDLTQKDFRIWEDGKEQKISSFSLESSGVTPERSQKHYIVLFFDTSTINPSSQLFVRQEALRFVDGFASPDRYMAVINYGGGLQITQNFTSDAVRLKKALSLVQGSSVPSAGSPPPALGRATAACGRIGGAGCGVNTGDTFDYRNMLASLRGVANSLANIRGRKALVLFSGGVGINSDLNSDITATIDACNKANVAVYTVDGRGFVGELRKPDARKSNSALAFLDRDSSLFGSPYSAPLAMSFFQAKGGGTTGGGTTGGGTTSGGSSGAPTTGTPGGTTGGTPGGTTGGIPGGTNRTGSPNPGSGIGTSGGGVSGPGISGANMGMPASNGRNAPIFPQADTVANNQAVLRSLADGTGGLMFANVNDLASSLGKIAQEQDQYYLLGYTPSVDSAEGTCHSLRVKVDRGGIDLRSRKGYCTSKPADLLAGKPVGKDLEMKAAASTTGNIGAKMQLPYFYSGPNVARVNLAVDLVPSAMTLQKDKGKLHGEFNLAGIAYKSDGSVAARFSDTVRLDFDSQQQADAFLKTPYHYANQFEIAPGKYNFRMAVSSGDKGFGKIDSPLAIEPWNGKSLSVSGLALSHEARPAADLAAGLDESLLEGALPLVS